MKIIKLLELASLVNGESVRYEGKLDIPFNGFAMPGTGTKPDDRFYVLMDRSWSESRRKQSRQSQRTLDEVLAGTTRREIQSFVLPHVLRGADFTRNKNCLYVDDSFEFIGQLGIAAREQAREANKPLVGVTGAAGKSTFKAMAAHAYYAYFPDQRVLSPGPYFNVFDRVLGELARIHDFDAAFLELSGGIFDRFSQRDISISPDVAVVTTISEAHTAALGSAERVAKQKSGIFSSPGPASTAVINADTLHSDILLGRARDEGWRLALFGESSGLDYRLLGYDPERRIVDAETPYGRLNYYVDAHGKHMAYNSLAVLATVRALGIDDPNPAIESFQTFGALPGRGANTDVGLFGGGYLRIMDESYNANPASMEALVSTLHGMKLDNGLNRKVAVLGDMLELGATEKALHRKLWEWLARTEIDEVYLYGPLMREVYEEASGDERVRHFSSRDELILQLQEDLGDGDLVAFKSSHSMELDKVIQSLMKTWKAGEMRDA